MKQEYPAQVGRLERNELGASMATSLLLLMEALACHAINYDYDDCTAYQRSMRENGEKLENAVDGQAAAAVVTETINLMKGQTEAVEGLLSGLATEKQAIIHMLTESLVKICDRSETAEVNLRALEKELAKASQVEELRTLKDKLALVLEAVCKEAESQERPVRDIQPALKALGEKKTVLDNITGLPGMSQAEEMFKLLALAGGAAYVVALTIRNLDVVNRRISFSAGNKLLVLFSQEIAQRLSGNDRLFRWRGPCFVAVLPRDTGLTSVRQEAAKFGSISQERSIEDEHSSLFFKMSTSWRLFTVPRVSDLAKLSSQIDAFLLGETPREPGTS
jgi:GGDEF domain-containing protein